MKKWFSLLIILPILLMSACGVAKISYRLTSDHMINTDYVIELESDNTDGAQYTNAIMQYWNDMGFTPALTQTDGKMSITGKKSESYDSSAAAADAFSALLTDESSLFENVSFSYEPTYEYDNYSLKATVSLKDIIRQNEPQSIPEGDIDQLNSDAADGTYTLSLTLPGEVVSTNADDTKDGVCTWNLAYGDVTEISLETSKLNQENIDEYAALTAQQHRDNMLLLAGGAVAIILIVALIIANILRNRKDRPLKVHVKKV